MPLSARLSRLLTALSLTLPLLSAAQTPPLTDAERARRDAEKVLSFIKFQTVRTKPADAADKPRKPAPPATTAAPHAAPRPAATARADTPAGTAAAAPAPALVAASEHAATPQPEPAAASFAAPAGSAPMPTPTPPAAEPEAEADDADEVPLQLQRYVAPVLSATAQSLLVTGSRTVTVRFTVEANGSVSKAEALADAPRRLARPATDAVLQWQFAPLAQARTVDVDIAFRRE
ncbi:energy transducer TonB [Roseateles sp. DXS20W]|uniref:Energy transducer TonB n=1 Tax=Pelomonas lactea TaxID=3299030 RepID=A0ABW7GM26_9BURK